MPNWRSGFNTNLYITKRYTAPSQRNRGRLDALAIAIVGAAVFMNFFLAIINAHGMHVSRDAVIVVQLVITSAAVGLILARPPKMSATYYFSLGVLLVLSLASILFRQSYDLRFFYDAAVIPVFALLGSTVQEFDGKWLRWLLAVVVTIALCEVFLPDLYLSITDPLNYYIATREWAAQTAAHQSLTPGDIGFYVGAERAGGEIFGLTNHRVGSIFLEPISLGYFAVIVGLGLAYYHQFRFRPLVLPLLGCLLLTLLSDTRTAVMLLVVLLLFGFVLRRMPAQFGFYVPIMIFAIGAIAYFAQSAGGHDPELAYRLGITFSVLETAPLSQILFGGIDAARAGDSGFLSLTAYSGILGTLLYFYVASGFVIASRRTLGFSISIMIYLATTALFGGGFFSIKTGALLGFLTGVYCWKPQHASGRPVARLKNL